MNTDYQSLIYGSVYRAIEAVSLAGHCQTINTVQTSTFGEELERLVDDGSRKAIALSIIEE